MKNRAGDLDISGTLQGVGWDEGQKIIEVMK